MRVLPRLFATAAVLVTGCARPSQGDPAAGPAPRSPLPAHELWADSVLATLTPRERAAQLVWPQVFADYVPASSPQWRTWRRYLEQERVGGLIVSIGSPLEMAEKLNAFQRMSRVPVLVGADIEGGAGFRARGGYFVPNGIDLGGATLFPQQMALGAARDTALAYELGRITAVEGRALGIHIAYAPVLDVNNNADNPVIGIRSFGEDPALVARLGSAVVRGLQDHGMVATGKHFPGHGDTEVNSHLGLPVIPVTRARLDSVELVPFRAAIAAGVGSIMTAHIALPNAAGDSQPATISPAMMTRLLREELGFRGLLTTDAMDMRGVLATMGLAEATKRSIVAGADVILMPTDVPGAIDAIVAGTTEGRYTAARVDSSARRILIMKARLGLARDPLVRPDTARARVGDSAHVALARLAAERGITLVRDSTNLVPLRAPAAGAAATRVLSVTIARRNDLSAGRDFDAELRRRVPGLRTQFLDGENAATDFGRALRMADSADVVIVGVYALAGFDVQRAGGTASPVAEFVRALARKPVRTALVSFADPYLLRQVPEAGTYLIAWGGFGASQVAAARAIAGAAPITGRLPITIPGVAPYGAGLDRTPAAPAAATP